MNEKMLLLKNVTKFVDAKLEVFGRLVKEAEDLDIPVEIGNKKSMENIHSLLIELGNYIKKLDSPKETAIERDFCMMIILSIMPVLSFALNPCEFEAYTKEYMIPIIKATSMAKMHSVPFNKIETIQ